MSSAVPSPASARPPVSRPPVQRPKPNAGVRATNADRHKNGQQLTHFICLPIGHHASLRQSITAFTDGILQATPPIQGVDSSIAIAPRRLHITLGVMSLVDQDTENPGSSAQADGAVGSNGQSKTLSGALVLLQNLRPRILEMLDGQPLLIPLTQMDVMKPERGDFDRAHVLWLGSALDAESEIAARLRKVCGMIHKEFMNQGYMVDRRPLKLHCTVINTTYRRPRPRGARVPFSYKALLASSAGQSCYSDPSLVTKPDHFKKPIGVNFGTWEVSEIQICKMGSYGTEGEYVSCGGCLLAPT